MIIVVDKSRSVFFKNQTFLGTYDDFSSTSCYSELAFLGNIEGGDPERLDPAVVKYLETQLGGGSVTGTYTLY